MAKFVFTDELRDYYLAKPGSSEERVNRLKEAIEKKSDKFKITKKIENTGLEDRLPLDELEKKLGISEPGKEGEATTVSAAPVRLTPIQKVDKAIKDIKVAIGRMKTYTEVDDVKTLLTTLGKDVDSRKKELRDAYKEDLKEKLNKVEEEEKSEEEKK